MKLLHLFGVSILSLNCALVISNGVFAINTEENQNPTISSEITITKPSRAELRAAISQVENLENYHTYSLLTPSELQTTTKFASEYTYLFNLVAIAKDLDMNYDSANPIEIIDIIAAAKDAVIACRYLFGTVRTENSAHSNLSTPESSSSDSAAKPITPATTSPQTSTSSKPASSTASPESTSTATHTATSNNTTSPNATSPDSLVSATTTTETSTPDETQLPLATANPDDSNVPNVPATGKVEKSNKPLFITIGAVALACLLIGSMIILNRKKSYHPGRKF